MKSEDRLFSIISDELSKFSNNIIISELMKHSVKYNIPFHVIIAVELTHIPEYDFRVGNKVKNETNLLFAKTIFDTPRPYQLDIVKKKLTPIRGIIATYNDDPAIDCNNGIKKYLIRTTNYECNLENFLNIRSDGDTLLQLMAERLHQDKYIKKLVDKNIDYTIHRENSIVPPKDLSILVKQYEFYRSGLSIEESTLSALNSSN